MKPHKDETQSAFMSRCVPEMIGTDDDKRPQEQAVAICLDIWRQAHPGSKAKADIDPDDLADQAPDPEQDETREDYIDRCSAELMSDAGLGESSVDEDTVREACRIAWEQSRAARPTAKGATCHKTHAGDVNGMEFVLSDETVDRMGDVISSDGWELDDFKRNPIALFNHRSDFPIGKWRDLRVEDQQLRGHLVMAPKGTSDRIDELRRLIDAGILKAVSVGFRPIETMPRMDAAGHWLGDRYVRQELVETSLVSVPANPNALAVAKSLKISPATMNLVFAESGRRDLVLRNRGVTGESAKPKPRSNGKSRPMSLSQRIIDSQERITTLRAQLATHIQSVDDSNTSEADVEATTELNSRIAHAERGLAALREAEQRLAVRDAPEIAQDVEQVLDIRLPTRQIRPPSARPFTVPARKLEPLDFLIRTFAVLLKHHGTKGARPMSDIVRETYPGADEDGTSTIVNLIVRNPAATAPAMTTVPGWAQELVPVIMGEFWKALMPVSVYPKISAKGSTFTFGRYGIINLPMRSITPTISGSFIGEGAPIPVRQGQFVTQQVTPKKMGVITTFTREISEHSTPAIEGILRDAVLEDTGVALDSVLLGTNAATAIAPAGLFAGITPLTPTPATNGAFDAVLGDIKQLTGALIAATRGNFRAPVWLMSPALAVSLALTPTTGAQALPFREEVSRGFLLGYPIIQSTTVPMGWFAIMDCADFASVTGDDPRFEVSDQAVLHMEDTTPLAIGTPGTPPTVAAPARSLWQTDTIGLRLILPMNWVMRRAQSVALIQAVTWQ
jgi:HK97 family phage prohead protease/HK97 family phage major capsid protein